MSSSPGYSMPNRRSRARRRWISRKYSLRRRWPVYVIVLLVCAATVAVVVLMLNDIPAPAPPAPGEQRTPIPAAIRGR